ncbi:SDR family NAD(P)-dependent oxidoreductase [Halorubellus sp. PRR65]|uniref:SDR family NAD(P)-dependent oxidoreductase n=1 Tax=Halorubellus sp. PRR65 TaxID=3098148 RepID=UPI002B25D629|nr:SDR family NAD(P)-dependent oxidoreductase [Halorubellus sp. PRR65]
MNPDSAIVVGVGPGLGAAVTERLASEGVAVAPVARSADSLDELAADAPGPGTVDPYPGDATDPEHVQHVVDAVRDAHGPVDCLVLNVPGPDDAGQGVAETTPEAVERCWRMQVDTAVRWTDAALDDLRAPADADASGAVLATNSMAATTASSSPARGAARHGLRGLMRAYADILGARGVHVSHCLVGGWLDKPSLRERFPDHDTWTDPDAVADTVWHALTQPASAWTFEFDVRASGDDLRPL